MRIISKYKDYYDPIMRTGMDPSIVYIRTGYLDDPEIIYDNLSYKAHDGRTSGLSKYIHGKINDDLIDARYFGNRAARSIYSTIRSIRKTFAKTCPKYRLVHTSPYIIGFCGKFYVTYNMIFTVPDTRNPLYDKRYEKVLTSENDAVVKNVKNKNIIVIGEVPNIFSGNPDDIFIDLECPTFVIDFNNRYDNLVRGIDWLFFRNPVLRNYGLQKIVDPYTAYQELSMYLGSVLVNDDTGMENISDESLMQSKGFDKWSFKKLPQKTR